MQGRLRVIDRYGERIPNSSAILPSYEIAADLNAEAQGQRRDGSHHESKKDKTYSTEQCITFELCQRGHSIPTNSLTSLVRRRTSLLNIDTTENETPMFLGRPPTRSRKLTPFFFAIFADLGKPPKLL